MFSIFAWTFGPRGLAQTVWVQIVFLPLSGSAILGKEFPQEVSPLWASVSSSVKWVGTLCSVLAYGQAPVNGSCSFIEIIIMF